MAIVIGNMMTKHQIWRGTYFDKSPYRPKLKGTFKNLWYTFLGMSYNGNGDRKGCRIIDHKNVHIIQKLWDPKKLITGKVWENQDKKKMQMFWNKCVFQKRKGQKGLELSFCGLLGRLGENAHRYYQGGCSQSTQAVDHHIFGIQRTSWNSLHCMQ